MSSQAQTTLNTVPEGILTLNIPATGTSTLTRYFSLPLTADPVYSGAISTTAPTPIFASGQHQTPFGVSTGVDSITVDGSPFIAAATGVQLGNLIDPAVPYFVKFLSGKQTGRVMKVIGNSSSTLTLDTSDNSANVADLTGTTNFVVVPGDTFEVFPACTLASLFGDNSSGNPLAVVGGTSVFNADSIGIYNANSLKFQAYYFNTTAGHWEAFGSTSIANTTVVYPYSAVAITRRPNPNALSVAPMAFESQIVPPATTPANTLVPMSRVAEVPILTKTPGPGLVIYGSTMYPVDMTFAQLVLSGLLGSQWTKGTTAFNSDTVGVYNAVSFRFDTYYQLSTDNPPTIWHKVGATGDQSTSVTIPAGTAILILHRGAAAFLTSGMPYSLN